MVMMEKALLSTSMNAKLIGSGAQTLVLAHGFGFDQTLWDKTLPFLARHCRVLLFDWPFSGAVKDKSLYDPLKYSSFDAFANDLISLLEELNLKSVVFAGHSMSGMIGCIASVKRPELFKSLILIGASPRYLNSENYEGGFEFSDIEQIISNIEHNYDTWTQNFASLVVDPEDSPSVAKFEKCLKKMRPEVAFTLAKTVFLSDERDVLSKVSIPCKIIQTSKDIVVPNSVAFYMEKKIKNSTLEIIDTYGHFPQLTAHVRLLEGLGGALGLKFSKEVLGN